MQAENIMPTIIEQLDDFSFILSDHMLFDPVLAFTVDHDLDCRRGVE
jgi:hypothetical protein